MLYPQIVAILNCKGPTGMVLSRLTAMSAVFRRENCQSARPNPFTILVMSSVGSSSQSFLRAPTINIRSITY